LEVERHEVQEESRPPVVDVVAAPALGPTLQVAQHCCRMLCQVEEWELTLLRVGILEDWWEVGGEGAFCGF
jgi:hypothetical protein